MNLITSVVLCLVKEIFHLSGRVISKFMSKSEISISAKEGIQWRKLSSQNLLNIVHSTVLVAGVGVHMLFVFVTLTRMSI